MDGKKKVGTGVTENDDDIPSEEEGSGELKSITGVAFDDRFIVVGSMVSQA